MCRADVPLVDKRCHCVKSRCLKLYCDCFGRGVYCSGCACVDCQNTEEHEQLVASKRAGIREKNPEVRPLLRVHPRAPRPPSLRHVWTACGQAACSRRPASVACPECWAGALQAFQSSSRGCNCRRSQCLKMYCECYKVRAATSLPATYTC